MQAPDSTKVEELPRAGAPRCLDGAAERPTAQCAMQALGKIVLDIKGNIRFCSNALARLAGETPHGLTGRGVKSLLPGLPLDPATEGYNVAFGRFSASLRRMQSWTLTRYDGSSVQVHGYFTMLKSDADFIFSLDMYRSDDGEDPVQRQSRIRIDISPSRHHRPCLEPLAMSYAAASPMAVCSPDTIHLAIDRQFLIGFASSAIEPLLGIDYEMIAGRHVSTVLPELLPSLGSPSSIRQAGLKLEALGCITLFACHASGRSIPVTVIPGDAFANESMLLLVCMAAEPGTTPWR